MFEGAAAVGGAITMPGAPARAFSRKLSESFKARISEAGAVPSESDTDGGRSQDSGTTSATSEAVIATLRQLALDRSGEILQLCRYNMAFSFPRQLGHTWVFLGFF